MQTPNKTLIRAMACNREIPDTPHTHNQDCADVINISVFFDGTGNNKSSDDKNKKWSNIARIHDSTYVRSQDQFNKGIKNNYPIYISGVGTPFNGTAANWIDDKLIKAEDNIAGGASGAGGTRRTEFGQDNVNNALKQALLAGAQQLNTKEKRYATKGQALSVHELTKALGGHRLIRRINLSIFGFSRGAALARAFSNDFVSGCTVVDGQLLYQGFPVFIHFMGLFDTVASFGLPAANMDSFFTEKNLRIPKQVERCVHFVAAHELRFSFPVDLIRYQGRLPANWNEYVYPGVHSDVGGGYEPKNQGITNQLGRIPQHRMMQFALDAGVRMYSLEELKKVAAQTYAERFHVDPKVVTDFTNYMRAVAPSGSVEQQVKQHMVALYSGLGTLARHNKATPGQTERQSFRLWAGIDEEARFIRHGLQQSRKVTIAHVLHYTIPVVGAAAALKDASAAAYAQMLTVPKWSLDAWNSFATPAIQTMFSSYVHDSKAGFLMGAEPFSYFRQRGVTESSINILARGLRWFDEVAKDVSQNVIRVYYSAEKVVVERWTQGKKDIQRTYAVGEKFIITTGKTYALEIIDSTSKMATKTFDAGEKMVLSAVNETKSLALEVEQTGERIVVNVTKYVEDGWQKMKEAF